MMLECGHPKECLDAEDECRWCADLYSLRATIAALKDQIGKTAVVIHSGIVTISVPVGYLEMRGGNVHFEPASAAMLKA